MAVYAVGDIQGCYEPLRRLLDKVDFNPQQDVLWCAGDLVNRGPHSLETLRFLKGLGDSCVCVLGNHDLHLLERACGGRSYKRDTFEEVLAAKDVDALLEWLRHRPLMHKDEQLGWYMVHAGLHPCWNFEETEKRAKNVSEILKSDDWQNFCKALNDAEFPATEPKGKKGEDEKSLEALIFTTAVLTRTRYCTEHGVFNWHVRSGEADSAIEKPWFEHSQAPWYGKAKVVYGHWAAMGLVEHQPYVLGLDTGCVWGGRLSLARLDGHDDTIVSVHGLA